MTKEQKGKAVFEYDGNGVGRITLECMDMLMDIVASSMWIPCSERLPEEEGEYLATLHHKWPDREYKTVEVKKFRSGGFDESLYVKVVAWMPLPKPWEGEDDA